MCRFIRRTHNSLCVGPSLVAIVVVDVLNVNENEWKIKRKKKEEEEKRERERYARALEASVISFYEPISLGFSFFEFFWGVERAWLTLGV